MAEIEKNIPIPEYRYSQIYPFSAMAVGDSFAIKVSDGNVNRSKISSAVRSACSVWGKRNNQEYVVRSLKGEIRVWRIK